jgi:hypothetical protein
MDRRLLLPLGLGALALAWWLMVIVPRRRDARAALEAAADRYGLPREWLVALGETETRLDPSQVNRTGPDGERGGSWGVTQISARTARAFGYPGPMEDLLDPVAAAELSAQMIAAGFAERSSNPADPEAGPFRPVNFGMPQTFEDMLAVWNAGRRYADLPADGSTLVDYIPRAQGYLASLSEEA